MTGFVTRHATVAEACALAPRLRSVEVAELRAATGEEPEPVLIAAVRDSAECWVTFINNELAAMWGVVAYRPSFLGPRIGVGWLLTTPVVERYPLTFWRLCKAYLPRLLGRWDTIINAIDVRHEQALRWAHRLGFRLRPPEAFGEQGLPFQTFRVTKEDLRCAHRP